MVVYGGQTSNDEYLKDLRILYFSGLEETPLLFSLFQNLTLIPADTSSWLKIQLNQSYPIASARHASCLTEGNLYIHGGMTANGISDQFCYFDFLSGWSALHPQGPNPPPLYGHTLTYVPETQNIYLFGGFSTAGFSAKLYTYSLGEYFSCLFSFISCSILSGFIFFKISRLSSETNHWTLLLGGGIAPPPTFGHVAIYHALTASIYFHGGVRDLGLGAYASTSILVFNVLTKSWTTPLFSGYDRIHHAGTLVDNVIIFHGGFFPLTDTTAANQCYYDEVFVYNICETSLLVLFFFPPR